MVTKSQNRNIVLALIVLLIVIAAVATIGFLVLGRSPEIIQGQVDVTEYRVSSKVPSRVLKLLVKEGDYVQVGDTVAIMDAPDVQAKLSQAEAAEAAASAVSEKAQRGTRYEQVQGAYELLQKAKAGLDIAEKSYGRLNRLYNEGVVSAQKRDETYANYKAMLASVKAAQSQYDMAVNGAQKEDKEAAAAQVMRAKGAVKEVNSYVKETVLTVETAGEVTEVFPEVGELVGTGAPIMNIEVLDDMWGTFNVREDQLKDLAKGKEFSAYVPAFDRDLKMKVYYVKDLGSFAAWKATKTTGQFDLRTFEVRAHPMEKIAGLRPGMSLVLQKNRDNHLSPFRK
jgi:HlyD family secretion protein